MKVLFVSHTANFSKFNRPLMRWFREQGWDVHYASAGEELITDCDTTFTIPLARSPLSPKNIFAYKTLKRLINENHYDIIHCHTPTGGVITRLAARVSRKRGTRVIYTAHGFHFYKGAPLQNWLLYYPIEKLLSYITDDLVTIDREDFLIAKKKMHAKRVHQIPGVGVDIHRYAPVTASEKTQLRQKHGYDVDGFILIAVAELNKNKNQQFLLRMMTEPGLEHTRLLLAGIGDLSDTYQTLAIRLGIRDRVNFLGYRHDLNELYQLSDVVVSASIREGLGLNIVEGMACGLPVVCSDNRGHRDIIKNNVNGWRHELDSTYEFATSIKNLSDTPAVYKRISQQNRQDAERFSLPRTMHAMIKIYSLHKTLR